MIAPLSIVVIGFVLGMRHPTDRDPVVAVTTIVGVSHTSRAPRPSGPSEVSAAR